MNVNGRQQQQKTSDKQRKVLAHEKIDAINFDCWLQIETGS